ncbi:Na+/H+ antiporter [Jongsikchunia kroppenstedtii]|uniref:Na+/H+ antiporter n=1 Tax=Jongsikchunia kroppenstedtii TaxID=1121721 RepID=UPI00035E3E9B|nr:Na+/H+ antiporter [Jongsikchunia kroppenstedtii]
MNTGLLMAAVIALITAAPARRYGAPAPLLLVLVGLGIAWIPGLPSTTLDPDFVLFIVLPPLLYAAALDSSYLALRRNVAAVSSLAVLLPLASTVVVGFVAYWVVPELPLGAAFVLGAIVAPPDAVAAQAIGRRLGLPRQIMTLLSGESLLNDATALTAYRIALGAAVGGVTSIWEGIGTFALAAVGGTAIGLGVGLAVSKLRNWLDDPQMETAMGLLAPFGIYWLGEEAHTSGVIAVVTAGLFLGQRSVREGYATRLQDNAVWKSLEVVLESFVFLLIGLQLPSVVRNLNKDQVPTLVWATIAVLGTVIVVRLLWVRLFAMTSWGLRRLRDPEAQPPLWRNTFVVGWAGMRGVVSLAAAFAIPLTTDSDEPFPARDEIIFITFAVVVGTLLLQGTTLPWVIRLLGVEGNERQSDLVAMAGAQDRAGRKAMARLKELVQQLPEGDPRREQAEALGNWVRARKSQAWEQLGRGPGQIGESPTGAYRRMRLEVLRVQRESLISDRDAGLIDDEVLRRALRQLDLTEGVLTDRLEREDQE